jgi:DNA gyrase subunit A
VIAIQTSERNGAVIGAVLVEDQDEVMLISTGGVLIRTAVSQIRELGRSTQGVTLIALGEGEKLAGVERIEERDVNGNGNGSGDAGNGGSGNGSDGDIEPESAPPSPTVH